MINPSISQKFKVETLLSLGCKRWTKNDMKNPDIKLFDSRFSELPEGVALELAQALRLGDVVLSAETQIPKFAHEVLQLHKISYAGNDYHIAAPASFDATEQFSYGYIDKDNYLLTAVL